MDYPTPSRKPRDDELDAYGITHRGKVRPTNQDHFLLATIHKHVNLVLTSLDTAQVSFADERLAGIMMVADGVGGHEGGERASAKALEMVMRYATSSTDCYYRTNSTADEFINALQTAAMNAHAAVLDEAKRNPDAKHMATTLTLFMGVWPEYYLLQVGDSRYYLYRRGELTQVTRDQTIAQELVDEGVLTRTAAWRSQFAHVLSSAIGGDQAAPVVTRLRSEWGAVHLLCSDGLTKHVSDEQIAKRLGEMTSSRQVCEQLLQDALDGGGTDNVTVCVGRLTPKDPPSK